MEVDRMVAAEGETARRIVAAAADLFGQRGYRSATTGAIAEGGGVNEGHDLYGGLAVPPAGDLVPRSDVGRHRSQTARPRTYRRNTEVLIMATVRRTLIGLQLFNAILYLPTGSLPVATTVRLSKAGTPASELRAVAPPRNDLRVLR
jgi:hypothetical protein